ncbi:SpoIID/LytB domain-containing protein [Bacillus sp. PAMC26568]|nr:SpoIID/LytB domain-containing protein [Bacillus sp. PAMC26568]
MLKKIFAFSLFLLIIPFSINAKAATDEIIYEQPISVEVKKAASAALTLHGLYYVKTPSEKILVSPGTIVNLQKNSSTLTAAFGAFNVSSTSEIEIKEAAGAKKIVSFTNTVWAKNAPGATSQNVIRYYNGEAAEYVKSVIISGTEWYIIQAKNGSELAVPKDNSVSLKDVPDIALLSLSTDFQYRGSIVYNQSSQLVNKLSMESYLKGVVPNEMPASWTSEALKAQAVAARSYAHVKSKRGILSSSVSSQVYKGYKSENSNTNRAIDDTKGLVVKNGNTVIETFFHSTSGGRTANVGDVWNSPQSSFPYLVSVADGYEASPHSTWQDSFKSEDILKQFGFNSGTTLYGISIEKKGANGEVGAVTVNTSAGDKRIAGNELTIRKLFPLPNYYGLLRSNWFTMTAAKSYQIQSQSTLSSQFGIKGHSVQTSSGVSALSNDTVDIQVNGSVITKETDPKTIVLNGKGWGHRIGMSQYGAKGYAENGWTYTRILNHYFQGTTIGSLN